ncbi:MAG: hypothetical protein QHH04_09215 [Methanolinea sp.]|jgi:hypothetical protein|nr:hypothetical protein [Methanolinea sp.]
MQFKSGNVKSHLNLIIKFIAILGLGLIFFSLYTILLIPPASNYEFSIYDSYPFYFWLTLIFAIIIGISILAIIGFNDENENNQWIFGLLIIFLVNSILLFMPFVRGYLNFGYGDVLTHIGWMKDILRTGYVSYSNMYPIDHVLGVILHFFTGLSLQDITMIIPGIFSFFFIASFYLLSIIFFFKQSERLILLIFSSILLFGNGHMAFAPNPQAFMLLPLFLYLIFKNISYQEKRTFSLLLIIISILLIFFHPLISIIIIFIFIFFKGLSWIPMKSINKFISFHKQLNNPLFLSIILFLSWSSYIYVMIRTIKPIIQTILGSVETVSEFQRYSGLLGEVNVDFFYIIRLILNVYGQGIILGMLSLICSIFIFFKILKNDKIPNFIFITLFLFLFLFIGSIVMFFINGAFGFGRMYSCALLFSIILIPSTILLMKSNSMIKFKLIKIILFVILIGIVWFSTFNLYYSPIIKYPNLQVTKSEFFGITTFYQYRDDNIQILEYGLSQDRLYDAIYGRDYPRKNIYYANIVNQLLPPDHFNYNINNTLGINYQDTKYFIFTNQGKFFYQNMYPEFPEKWRFTPSDFERLNIDQTVEKIYINGNLDIRLIE